MLIVIGLLVAGVTGGASLIKSSELRSVMSEARGYSVAVSGFFSQFNALPGDFDTSLGIPDADGSITYTNAVGNNNDKIEYCDGTCTATGDLTGSENTVAWYHLRQSGAIDSSISYRSAQVAQNPGEQFPASKVKSAGWVFDHNADSEQNIVVLTGPLAVSDGTSANTVVNGTTLASGVITPADALSVDSKIDDGVANTGKIRSVLTSCATTATYNVTDKDKECAISYQIDVNS